MGGVFWTRRLFRSDAPAEVVAALEAEAPLQPAVPEPLTAIGRNAEQERRGDEQGSDDRGGRQMFRHPHRHDKQPERDEPDSQDNRAPAALLHPPPAFWFKRSRY